MNDNLVPFPVELPVPVPCCGSENDMISIVVFEGHIVNVCGTKANVDVEVIDLDDDEQYDYNQLKHDRLLRRLEAGTMFHLNL